MNLLQAIRQILGFTGPDTTPPRNNVEALAAYDPDRTRAVPLAAAAYGLIDPVTGDPVSGGGGAGAATPGGTDTQLQYRNGTALGGIAGSSWDGTTLSLPPINSNTIHNATFGPLVITNFSGGGMNQPTVIGGSHVMLYGPSATVYISDMGGGTDLALAREAAGVLALRNGTNGQALNVYQTYTDASNYRRIEINTGTGWSGPSIVSRGVGTTADAGLTIGPAVYGELRLLASGSTAWYLSVNGNFLAGIDNTYDIGSGGANRPSNVFVAQSVYAGARLFGSLAVYCGSGTTYSGFSTAADGVMTLIDNSGSNFNRLQFGGTTASFPALKRSGASIEVRLADDSAYAGLVANDYYATTAFSVGLGAVLQFSDGSAYSTVLRCDAANTLALKNGTNANIINVYGSYTDGSNYKRLKLGSPDGTNYSISAEGAGTGLLAPVLRLEAASSIEFYTDVGNVRWRLQGGHWLAASNGAYDIGDGAGHDPRRIYVTNDIYVGQGISATRVSVALIESAGGVLSMKQPGETYFNRINFGDAIAANPAIKRSGSDIEVVKADGTAADTAVIISSPNGTRYRVTVSNAGAITTSVAP